ncbi:uncharacterized protein TRAVEDRAFT_44074 [Trametes versicolor FP-101664 SS1]|uniref:uncharacterized protein n=1 Tax=Trametes versicolor (strain FP-101664) TaxID=717944 RepID=UPI0004622433|nr:uncharacterized protein TRAVEDRAFT_44074 [Trametes versicolor FP-101664 SS1]EIW61256.1 hypothetical protein TRAVEDRAFT_44074 [Trametes versicolor FP-101664 SS1]
MFLKNAEVQTFNGCGYCKWAKTNPPPRLAGYQNQGWPGCCRAPNPGEYKFIGAADWPTVSLVHHIPIPPEIKAILDGITAPRGASPLAATSPTGTVRSATVQAAAPVMSRRSSTNVASPTRNEAATAKGTVAVKRSGGSPQQGSVSLSGSPRGAAGDGAMASLSKASTLEQHQSSRRSAMDVFAEKRPDPSNTTQHSPGRKHTELSGSLIRRSSEQRRPSISASPPSALATKADATPQRRRTAPSTPNAPAAATLPQPIRPVERPAPEPKRGSPLEEAVEKMSLSSASSSSSGSSSETTVISDGGFTDYLSDESEAELQRQAEAKAAVQAQNQLEELEFKAARQQLAHVDLRPPKSWRTDIHSSTPRSQVPAARTTSSYGQPFGAAPAFAASAASTHSRG